MSSLPRCIQSLPLGCSKALQADIGRAHHLPSPSHTLSRFKDHLGNELKCTFPGFTPPPSSDIWPLEQGPGIFKFQQTAHLILILVMAVLFEKRGSHLLQTLTNFSQSYLSNFPVLFRKAMCLHYCKECLGAVFPCCWLYYLTVPPSLSQNFSKPSLCFCLVIASGGQRETAFCSPLP